METEGTITVKTPWVKNLGDVPAHLEYPDCSMYEAVDALRRAVPQRRRPMTFMGRKTTYTTLMQEVNLLRHGP